MGDEPGPELTRAQLRDALRAKHGRGNERHELSRANRPVRVGSFPRTSRSLRKVHAYKASSGSEGNFREIGVYEGKSAVLFGYALRDGESLTVRELFGRDADTAVGA